MSIRLARTLGLVLIALPGLATAQTQFDTVDEAAIHILSTHNAESIQHNIELGGYLYLTPDGGYASTRILRGRYGSLHFPPPDQLVPADGQVVASWHTHGAAMAGIVSETFSPQDINLNQKFGIDGYLATPSGQLKHYRLNDPEIRKLEPVPD